MKNGIREAITKIMKEALLESRSSKDGVTDFQLRKTKRKDQLAQWKRQKNYPMPGQQKPGFAKSPTNETDATPCQECGMVGGHMDECSMMAEAEADGCPECGGPPGKHDPKCPLADEPGDPRDDRRKDDRGHVIDEDDDDEDEDEHDDEACPGCGVKPGDGVNPKCDDPLGCGYWRDFKTDAEGKRGSLLHMLRNPPESIDGMHVDDIEAEPEGFEANGIFVRNPFWDETGREEVDPEEHYRDAFKNSGLAKRMRWGESSDYDGLPLTEMHMFDRFDTLVGHRSDGTFNDRANDASRLRSLIKKVVSEILGTSSEDLGEMKLSVAGPAFGATSDTDDQDDADEDYKVLTPRKTPEPEESGVRVKNNKSKSKR